MPQHFDRSCDNCRRLKIRCDRIKPHCKNCGKRKVSCTRNKPLQKRGPKPKSSKRTKHTTKVKVEASPSPVMGSVYNPSPSPSTYESSDFATSPTRIGDAIEDFKSEMDYNNDDEESETSSMLSYATNELIEELKNELKEDTIRPISILESTNEIVNPLISNESNNNIILPSTKEDHILSYKQRHKMLLFEEMLKRDYNKMMEETLRRDKEMFKSKLSKFIPSLINQEQYDYIVYYFDNIHDHIPLISADRFITLINIFIQNNATHIIKNLIDILCQVSYLYINKPIKFRNIINTFLLLCNLDSIITSSKTPANMPHLLINTYSMLINYYQSVTNFT